MPGRLLVAVVNYNGGRLGDIYWRSVESYARETGGPVEAWIVDNASTDGSGVEAARRTGLRLLRLQRNLGYAGACLAAIKAAEARGEGYRFYACANNDLIVHPEALRRLHRVLATVDQVFPGGFVASPLLVNGYTGLLDPAGVLVDRWGRTWGIDVLLRSPGLAERLIRGPRPVVYADGAFIVYSRPAVERGAFMDPRFFLYYEDAEAGLRAWRLGVPVLLLPLVLGTHYRSASSGGSPTQVMFEARNRAYSLARHMGAPGAAASLLWLATYPIRLLDHTAPRAQHRGSHGHGGGGKLRRLAAAARGVLGGVAWGLREGVARLPRPPAVAWQSFLGLLSPRIGLREARGTLRRLLLGEQ
ncbi:MAG: glycosyltransferase [Desulfurococcales archaeon]|nr:glycosyltransferase [Desulfurococcales archaeon]